MFIAQRLLAFFAPLGATCTPPAAAIYRTPKGGFAFPAPRTINISLLWSEKRNPDYAWYPVAVLVAAMLRWVICLICGTGLLEVDAELGTQHERVLELARAAGPSDVLQIGLDKVGAVAEIETISRFYYRLAIRNAAVRTKQPASSLRAFQVFAEVTGCDAYGNDISRPRVEQPARRNACRDEQRQLLDAGIRCDSRGAEDAESAIAARNSEWDEHLIKEPILAPASALAGPGIEIGKLRMVVPSAELVIA